MAKCISVYSLAIICTFCGCSRLTEKRTNEHYIMLVTFGQADSPSDKNKNYGIQSFSYINLEDDSVFTRIKIYDNDSYFKPKLIETKAGIVSGISNNDTLLKGLAKIEELPNGDINEKEVPEGALYCGITVFLKYVKKNVSKYYIYRPTHVNPLVTDMTWQIFRFCERDEVKAFTSSKLFNEDSIVIELVNSKGVNLQPLALLDSTVQFVPPIIVE